MTRPWLPGDPEPGGEQIPCIEEESNTQLDTEEPEESEDQPNQE